MSFDQAEQMTINDSALDNGTESQTDLSATVWEEMDQQTFDTQSDNNAQMDGEVLDFSVNDPFAGKEDFMTAQFMEPEEEALELTKHDEVIDEIEKVEFNQNPDGDDLFPEEKDGDIVETDKDGATIVRDENGRIKSTTSPRGRTTTFDYDEEGNLKQINMPNSTLRKEGDQWTYEKDGVKTPIEGHVDITPDGDLVHLKPDGTMDISHPDGSRTEFDENGAQVTRNPNGEVKRTVSPKGTVTELEYDADGNVDKIKMGDKSVEREGDKWVKKDANGNKISEYDGEVDVDHETGNLIFTEKDGTQVVSRPDGSQVVTHPDGREEEIPAKK